MPLVEPEKDMDEFEFLDAQFRRLSEVRRMRHRDDERIKEQHTGKKVIPHSSFETAELMLAGVIRDYLKLRHNAEVSGATRGE